ncbi:MAG: PorT family protein [Flavobacterium sp.]|uniref:PorT family protein n=1 Tax=Flavobacterium sp. TaxID=239 RepID=UPI003265F75A
MKKLILFSVLLFNVMTFAQYNRRDGNRIGIMGGITQTSLKTSNFVTKPESGWVGGLSVRGNYYDNFSAIFGMQFFENHFSVETLTPLLNKVDVDYKTMGVQIRLLASYNLIKDHVSIDFGPVLQVNDKLKIDSKYELNNVVGTFLTAKEITDVTKINGNAYIGISAGTKRIRAVVNYQYGLNNFLNNLNKTEELKLKNNNSNFKGNLGIISGQLLINL